MSSRPRAIARAALVTNRRLETESTAASIVERLAAAGGVELVEPDAEADLVISLGGDGTMLHALHAKLGSGTAVFGFNFGRVGFLTSAPGDELEAVLPRVFAGDFDVVALCTLEARLSGDTQTAVNDIVATSARPGRMIELGWEIGGETLADQPCDGIICSTPSGSTAYNLSNGGPVMMWGLDAMAITFVAPHSLHARPIVVPPGQSLRISNLTTGGSVSVLADGRGYAELATGETLEVALGPEKCLLAHLPEVSFFTRYHDVFP
ncbi:MAG TPA: NAD(+)/NADH kinase [Gaiellaceae bacterium]|nr:NAD(+)/NADH kinase [Gaiellaceae bacterium]